MRTPAEDGFYMPAEWETHASCLVSSPCKKDIWCGHHTEAKNAYLEVIRAINRFEPVIVLANASVINEARSVVGRILT